MKIVSGITLFLIIFISIAATLPLKSMQQNNQENSIIVSRFNKTAEGKVYYEVDGKPFLFIGTEIRVDAFQNCERQTIEDMEKYFKAAKNLGVTTVLIPIEWKTIE